MTLKLFRVYQKLSDDHIRMLPNYWNEALLGVLKLNYSSLNVSRLSEQVVVP